MTLRPMANLFVARRSAPVERARVAETLRGSSLFDDIAEIGATVVAIAHLPGQRQELERSDASVTGWADGADATHRSAIATTSHEAPEQLATLGGDFTLCVATPTTTTLVRSVSGVVPWWYTSAPDGDFTASTLASYFALFDEFEPDPFAHLVAADGVTYPDRDGPIAGTRLLPTGATVSFTGTSVDENRYWSPRTFEPASVEPREFSRQVRHVLATQLESDLDPSGRNLIGMSGGVDSTTIGSIATHDLGIPLDAFTLTAPAGSPPYLAEAPYVASAAAAIGPRRHIEVPLTEHRRLSMNASGPRVGLPVPHPALSGLDAMVADRDTLVMTGGEFADDLFAGPLLFRTDWLAAIGPIQLARSLVAPNGHVGRRRLLRSYLGRRRRRAPHPWVETLGPAFRPELRERYAQWVRDGRALLEHDDHPRRFLLSSLDLDGWLAQNWEVCSRRGMRRSMPFCQRDLYELVLTSDIREHAMPPKRLLRTVADDIAPALNLQRTEKGGFAELQELELPFVVSDAATAVLTDAYRELVDRGEPVTMTYDDADRVACLVPSLEDPLA